MEWEGERRGRDEAARSVAQTRDTLRGPERCPGSEISIYKFVIAAILSRASRASINSNRRDALAIFFHNDSERTDAPLSVTRATERRGNTSVVCVRRIERA